MLISLFCFCCFILQLVPCFGFAFLCVLVSFVFNWLISFLVSFACWVNLLYFILLGCFGFVYVCICVCIFHYFCYYLLDCVFAIRLGFIFCFLFFCCLFVLFCFSVCVLIPFNAITNHLWNLSSPARDSAVSPWSMRFDAKP